MKIGVKVQRLSLTLYSYVCEGKEHTKISGDISPI